MGHTTGVEYRIYVLRCWREKEGLKADWRFLIQEVSGFRRRQAFSSLEGVLQFLAEELNIAPDELPPPEG